MMEVSHFTYLCLYFVYSVRIYVRLVPSSPALTLPTHTMTTKHWKFQLCHVFKFYTFNYCLGCFTLSKIKYVFNLSWPATIMKKLKDSYNHMPDNVVCEVQWQTIFYKLYVVDTCIWGSIQSLYLEDKDNDGVLWCL